MAVIRRVTENVKNVDAANGKVTLADNLVKRLNWPAMTTGFVVKDKMLFDKLADGKNVNVEFIQQNPDYVVAAMKPSEINGLDRAFRD